MDRRKGPTLSWKLFWRFVYGERRVKERRASRVGHTAQDRAGGSNRAADPAIIGSRQEKT